MSGDAKNESGPQMRYCLSMADEDGGENRVAVLHIYEDVTDPIAAGFGIGVSARDVVASLREWDDAKEIEVHINSRGGAVNEGVAIYNTLRRHKAQVTVYVDGLAASIASVIAMAGDRIVMPETALMMVHNPWTLAMGDSREMRRAADVLDVHRDAIVAAYHAKTGLPVPDIIDMMDDETWLTAAQAHDLGFCDVVEGDPMGMVAASVHDFDFSCYERGPDIGLQRSRAVSHPRTMKAAVNNGGDMDKDTNKPEGADEETISTLSVNVMTDEAVADRIAAAVGACKEALEAEQAQALAAVREQALAEQNQALEAQANAYEAKIELMREQAEIDADAAVASALDDERGRVCEIAATALDSNMEEEAIHAIIAGEDPEKFRDTVIAALKARLADAPTREAIRPDAGGGDRPTMPKSEYDRLDDRGKTKFFQSGGKLIDG